MSDLDSGWTDTWKSKLEDGAIALPRCLQCAQFHWYPLPSCPRCFGEWEWHVLSGQATVFTWTRVEHAFDTALVGVVPYVTGLVTPIEASSVRLVVRFLDSESTLELDAAVELSPARVADTEQPYLEARIVSEVNHAGVESGRSGVSEH